MLVAREHNSAGSSSGEEASSAFGQLRRPGVHPGRIWRARHRAERDRARHHTRHPADAGRQARAFGELVEPAVVGRAVGSHSERSGRAAAAIESNVVNATSRTSVGGTRWHVRAQRTPRLTVDVHRREDGNRGSRAATSSGSESPRGRRSSLRAVRDLLVWWELRLSSRGWFDCHRAVASLDLELSGTDEYASGYTWLARK